MVKRKIVIAIDGYSSCGKSTLAKDVAKHLKYAYVDTGAMYRAVTLFCLNYGIIREGNVIEKELEEQIHRIHISFKFNDETLHNDTYLDGKNVEEDIRSMRVASYVSQVSAIKFVRQAMVAQQQEMGKDSGIVMDGRDIGTVVFPSAELKIFLTADPDIRAQRRFDELKGRKNSLDFAEVKKNLTDRDEYDMNRKESPLRRAEDAIVLDNSELTMQQQAQWVIDKAIQIIEN